MDCVSLFRTVLAGTMTFSEKRTPKKAKNSKIEHLF